MASIRLERVTKRFGPVEALVDLTLEAADGEFLVLLGPSGCGKSTALRIIAGLEAPTSGRVWIGERSVDGVDPRDRDLAFVFQNYALYPHKSVYENLAFPLRLRRLGRPEVDRRVREAARLLGLEGLLDRRPRELSGGQRQRVALGRAVVRQPQAFLMDEPLSNLDARLREGMRAELRRLQRRLGVTTVYVTHDQVEALGMGDRVAVLRAGRLQQVGTPREVFERPANRFVAGFVGTPAMNFVRARVEVGPDRVRVRVPGQAVEFPVSAWPVPPPPGEWDLGFRPADAALGGRGPALAGRVVLAEYLGRACLVHVDLAGTPVVAEVSGRAVPGPGESVRLAPRPERLLAFDPRTGERVWP